MGDYIDFHNKIYTKNQLMEEPTEVIMKISTEVGMKYHDFIEHFNKDRSLFLDKLIEKANKLSEESKRKLGEELFKEDFNYANNIEEISLEDISYDQLMSICLTLNLVEENNTYKKEFLIDNIYDYCNFDKEIIQEILREVVKDENQIKEYYGEESAMKVNFDENIENNENLIKDNVLYLMENEEEVYAMYFEKTEEKLNKNVHYLKIKNENNIKNMNEEEIEIFINETLATVEEEFNIDFITVRTNIKCKAFFEKFDTVEFYDFSPILLSIYSNVKDNVDNNIGKESMVFVIKDKSCDLLKCNYSLEETNINYKLKSEVEKLCSIYTFSEEYIISKIFKYLKIQLSAILIGKSINFKDMVSCEEIHLLDGVRKEGVKSIYNNFEQLYLNSDKIIKANFNEEFIENSSKILWNISKKINYKLFSTDNIERVIISSEIKKEGINRDTLELSLEQLFEGEEDILCKINKNNSIIISKLDLYKLLQGYIYKKVEEIYDNLLKKEDIQNLNINIIGDLSNIQIVKNVFKEFIPGQQIKTETFKDAFMKIEDYCNVQYEGKMDVEGKVNFKAIEFSIVTYDFKNNEVELLNKEKHFNFITRSGKTRKFDLYIKLNEEIKTLALLKSIIIKENDLVHIENLDAEIKNKFKLDEMKEFEDNLIKLVISSTEDNKNIEVIPVLKKDSKILVGKVEKINVKMIKDYRKVNVIN